MFGVLVSSQAKKTGLIDSAVFVRRLIVKAAGSERVFLLFKLTVQTVRQQKTDPVSTKDVRVHALPP